MPRPDPWACAVCAQTWPVPSLARACEQDHQAQQLQQEDET